MNTINQIDTYYLRASRTVETILIKNKQKTVYVYNYEGNHFRLFSKLVDLINFFKTGIEPKLEFSNECDLDHYIINKL